MKLQKGRQSGTGTARRARRYLDGELRGKPGSAVGIRNGRQNVKKLVSRYCLLVGLPLWMVLYLLPFPSSSPAAPYLYNATFGSASCHISVFFGNMRIFPGSALDSGGHVSLKHPAWGTGGRQGGGGKNYGQSEATTVCIHRPWIEDSFLR